MAHELLQPWRSGVDGVWDRGAAAHLLRRAGFGAASSEIERALADGFGATLDRLFTPRGHDSRLFAGISSLLAAGDIGALRAWWMALILGGGDALGERMTLVWHNHFATSFAKVGDVRTMHRQNQTMRELALGDFRKLLHAMARDPAMLVWLDGSDNRAGHANENFAREVLELFALGIGNYSEKDVQEAARAFTGWGTEGREFVVRAEHHDSGTKTIFGSSGAFDGDQAIELVLAQPACAKFVAARLLREFVSTTVAPELVDELARTLVAYDWSIGKTLRTLFESKLFFTSDARRSRIASPVELVVGSLRTLEARAAPLEVAELAARMGQALFAPPSVKGWDGGRAWINAGSWIERANFGFELAAAVARKSDRFHIGAVIAPAQSSELPKLARDLLITAPVTAEFERALGDAAANSKSLDDAIAAVCGVVLTSPEYQLV